MIKSRLAICVMFILVAAPDAHAFKILSALTEGCHEKITIGVFGQSSPGFNGDGIPSVAALLARFSARAQIDGIPQDDASRGLRREMANRYQWQSKNEAELYVLASFIAGVRAPDTGGYSIIDFSQIRESHIRDDGQSAHFLRREADEGAAGDINVINETSNRLRSIATNAMTAWKNSGSASRIERWTFAFYGEQNTMVFGPAYDLGLIAHAIQDSYAHALRDENDLKVIAIENYLQIIFSGGSDGNHGPGHSERLDQCNENDSFDLPRIDLARKQTARVFDSIDQQFAVNGTDPTGLNMILDEIFAYKSGCDSSNLYCNSLWYRKAQEEMSEPYEIGCGLLRRSSGGGGQGLISSLSPTAVISYLLTVILFGLPIWTAIILRRNLRN